MSQQREVFEQQLSQLQAPRDAFGSGSDSILENVPVPASFFGVFGDVLVLFVFLVRPSIPTDPSTFSAGDLRHCYVGLEDFKYLLRRYLDPQGNARVLLFFDVFWIPIQIDPDR